jgi:hypothetical protein
MRRWVAVGATTAVLAVGGCGGGREPGTAPPTPAATPTGGTASPSPRPGRSPGGTAAAGGRNGDGSAVLIGAGDIATCDSDADARTASVVQSTAGTVFALGDNAYPDGSARDFASCYDPTWGRFKARTRPVAGNHEYVTRQAGPYFDYFGDAAGERGRGYYSYEMGSWHVVVLNSNCGAVPGGCGAGAPQERWLRADLAAHRDRCAVAMWHHPLFTSGHNHKPATSTRPLFRALLAGGVELLLTGHNHQYERFAPQDADGQRDDAHGVREFVVGTGGASLYPFDPAHPNSEVRNNDTFGVLRLTLHPDRYDWKFLPAAGGSFTDAGSGTCH